MLACSKNSMRRKLLAQWAGKTDLLAVSECISNILKGKVKLTPQQLKKLRRYRRSIHLLAKKTGTDTEKRRVITQHGGFFNFLGSSMNKAEQSLAGYRAKRAREARKKKQNKKNRQQWDQHNEIFITQLVKSATSILEKSRRGKNMKSLREKTVASIKAHRQTTAWKAAKHWIERISSTYWHRARMQSVGSC